MLVANPPNYKGQYVPLFSTARSRVGRESASNARAWHNLPTWTKKKGHGSLPCPFFWLIPSPRYLPKSALVLDCGVLGSVCASRGRHRAAGSYCGGRHLRFNNGITGGAVDIVSRAVHNVGFRTH